MYGCMATLVSLSLALTTIQAMGNTYYSLLFSQSDKNLKIILLDLLYALKVLHRDVMVDMMRVTLKLNLYIWRKVMDIALD